MTGFAFLTGYRPDEVMFWSGAGISIDPPTRGPAGNALTNRALDCYFRDGTREELTNLYARLDVPNAAFRPRLETVLDALVEVQGLHVLSDVLSDLAVAPPNRNHYFFAEHLKRHGHHATANFGTCIERAGLYETLAPVHFHGQLAEEESLGRLGARLGVIENGFPTPVSTAVDRLVSDEATAALVFVGYSGSDFFDVTPYLRERASLFAGKQVIWYEHSASELPSLVAATPDDHAYVRMFRAAGAKVTRVRGPLGPCLDELANAWGLDMATEVSAPADPWTQAIFPSERDRLLTTLALYARMGWRRRYIGLAEGNDLPDNLVSDRLADALWGAGQYRTAMAKWRIAFAGADFESRARLAEREGSTLWIRGSLIRAERRLAQAVARYCGASSVVSDQTQAVLAEAYARTLVHMRRSPDTRLLVRRHIVEQAEHALQHAEHRVRGHEGVHLRARLATARSLLTGDDDPLHADHAPAFSESESLHGWFNFRHSEKRYRFEHDGIRPEADDLRDLLRAQVEVGSYGDAARVLLLPGAEYAFSPRDFVKTWSRIDVTPVASCSPHRPVRPPLASRLAIRHLHGGPTSATGNIEAA